MFLRIPVLCVFIFKVKKCAHIYVCSFLHLEFHIWKHSIWYINHRIMRLRKYHSAYVMGLKLPCILTLGFTFTELNQIRLQYSFHIFQEKSKVCQHFSITQYTIIIILKLYLLSSLTHLINGDINSVEFRYFNCILLYILQSYFLRF